MTVGMRVALKIAYDGRAFYGHQRQPDARTVEGECLTALAGAKVIRNANEAFFRSASRTDRGVSAIGNVIAFNSSLDPEAVLGAFNDRAQDVWAWAIASVPELFHPRHAVQRWYRYHLVEPISLDALRAAGAAFVGLHDFRSFTSDPLPGLLSIDHIDVGRQGDATLVDVRAQSFRRGMVRRIVSAMVGHASGEIPLEEIRQVLAGAKADFGTVPPEPLVLMDVLYAVAFRIFVKPKVRNEWTEACQDAHLRALFLREFGDAVAEKR